jgi:hypothetical protein
MQKKKKDEVMMQRIRKTVSSLKPAEAKDSWKGFTYIL